MPGVTPLRPDDVHSARAWAAFAADDAAAAAPPSLEARVMRAAQAALAQKQRDEAERRRRQWFAGLTAIAASLLAAAAWSIAPPSPGRTRSAPGAAAPAGTRTLAATPPTAPMPVAAADEPAGRPVPMTNIEAGRVLVHPPHRLLASRPLYDSADGNGPVGTPGRLRAKAYGAPIVDPVAFAKQQTRTTPEAPQVAIAPQPVATPPAALAGAAPEAWSSRGTKPTFDPEAAEFAPAEPVFRLDQVTPVPPPREDPPVPPK
jgi:hypothetical protein